MNVGSVSSVMENLKDDYDKSKNKKSWRVLQGMNKDYYDTFIAGDRQLWQIKSEEVGPGENIAVGARISSFDEELEKIMRQGSPVPFGTVTPVRNRFTVIMSGVQNFSSESSNMLCKEMLSSKQAALEQELQGQVERMKDDTAFRRKYLEHKDRLKRAYL